MPTSSNNVISIRDNFELIVYPSSSRPDDNDFKRKSSAKYDLDHKLSAQIGPFEIVNGSPQVVPFQGLTTARRLYIETDAPVDLVFSGGSDRIRLQPPKTPAGAEDRLGRITLDGEFTSLTIENPNAAGDAPCVSGYMIGD